MGDKIKFINIEYLERAHSSLEAKRHRGIFPIRNIECCMRTGEDPFPDVMDALPYVELTRFQCQIIRDNIVEVIRFADEGRL